MKKILVLSSLLLFGLLFACSGDNNNEEQEETQPVNKTTNLQGSGESANDILSNTNFDKILIEVAYVTGFRPSNGAMTDFVTFIKRHTFKENVQIIYKELSSPNQEDLSLNEIDDLEQENRTVYNDEDTVAFYIYFADAPSEGDDEDAELVTLGAVYRNTSMVIFEKTIIDLASQSPFIIEEDIETPTLHHEFGHLFGLVNLGFEDNIANPLKTNMVNDHEDLSAPNHCTTPGCLMRAELQIGATNKGNSSTDLKFDCKLHAKTVLSMLKNKNTLTARNAADLGPECLLDLEANGGR